MKETYYEALGVSRTATGEEVRAAYRKLVLHYHPDHAADGGSADKFIRITQAYECLRDPERRKSYDRLLEMEAAPSPPQKQPAQPTTPRPQAHTRPDARFGKPRPTIDADLNRLRNLLHVGRFAAAEKLARQVITSEPTLAVPYAALGDIARARGDFLEAARLYAYAAQLDPKNAVYQRRHEEVLQSTPSPRTQLREEPEINRKPVFVGSVLILAAVMYVAASTDAPIDRALPLIGSWTPSLVFMLITAGIALGATLALSGLLDRYEALSGVAVTRVPPVVVLGFIALVNFWAAAGLYFFVGMTQNAFNAATSRVVGSVSLLTALFSLAGAVQGRLNPWEALLWGGNLLYLGAILGWMTTDSLRGE